LVQGEGATARQLYIVVIICVKFLGRLRHYIVFCKNPFVRNLWRNFFDIYTSSCDSTVFILLGNMVNAGLRRILVYASAGQPSAQRLLYRDVTRRGHHAVLNA
jgi:hypothetical protein